MLEDIGDLLPVKFRQNLLNSAAAARRTSQKSKIISVNKRPGPPSLQTVQPEKKTDFIQEFEDFFLSNFVKFHTAVAEKALKMFQTIKRQYLS